MNGCVFRRFGNEELINSKPQKIAKIDIDVCWANLADPEIEQADVSEDTIEKLDRERSLRRGKRSSRE